MKEIFDLFVKNIYNVFLLITYVNVSVMLSHVQVADPLKKHQVYQNKIIYYFIDSDTVIQRVKALAQKLTRMFSINFQKIKLKTSAL